MINGDEYTIVLEVTAKAASIGLVIVPPEYQSSMIEPSIKSDDLFRVRPMKVYYPMYETNKNVHVGNFASVEVFIRGAHFFYNSLIGLSIIVDDSVEVAARDWALMNAIKNTA
jgi:hypothetical protein